MISYDGKLLWSDQDEYITRYLLEFLYRYDNTMRMTIVNRRLRLAMDEFAKSIFLETKSDYPNLILNQKEKLFHALKEKEEKLQNRYGVSLVNGQTLNLETFSTVLNTTTTTVAGSSGKANNDALEEMEIISRKSVVRISCSYSSE
jgi:hypothetical protein